LILLSVKSFSEKNTFGLVKICEFTNGKLVVILLSIDDIDVAVGLE